MPPICKALYMFRGTLSAVAMFPIRFVALLVLVTLVAGIPAANAQGSWSTATSPTGEILLSVFMVSASDGWAVGDDGVILHYSGGSWSIVTSPTTRDLASVFMVSASDGWAVGFGGPGMILHYSGGSWSVVTSPTTDNLRSVFMVSASDGWAVGFGGPGTILHYTGPAPPPPVAPPVGGSMAPVNKLAVSAPYLSLLVLIGAATVAVATKRKRKA